MQPEGCNRCLSKLPFCRDGSVRVSDETLMDRQHKQKTGQSKMRTNHQTTGRQKKERKTNLRWHKTWKLNRPQYHNSMQETWLKWSRWRNYIKYEADILINRTKMNIERRWKAMLKQKDNTIWENTKSLLLSNDHQNYPPQVSIP